MYETIINFIDQNEFGFDSTLKKLKNNFPNLRHDSLRSILTQKYQRIVKKTKSQQLLGTTEKSKDLYRKFQLKHRQHHTEGSSNADGSTTIVDIAKRNKYSSALLAKIILIEHLNYGGDAYDKQAEKHVKELLKDTTLISDGKLAVEVWRACLEDENYGYTSDIIKASVGQEYERRLKRKLRKLGISYQVSAK